jgi:CDP-diacylglycerol--glycerol-3-phosphate 3-phosphatidyltransferase
MKKNLPNILTISRIIVIPIIVATFYIEDSKLAHKLAAGLFLLASITDFFDGYLARAWSMQSNLGRFLDPIADKLLVGAVILMLVHYKRADVIPALAIICREILVSGLREFLAELRIGMPVSKLAKLKTATQLGAIFILLLGSKGSGFAYADLLGRITLWVAAGLTVFTGYAYLVAGMKYMQEEK